MTAGYNNAAGGGKDANDIIYLDYNATCPIARPVRDAMSAACDTAWANPSCSHKSGAAAKHAVTSAVDSVRRLLGATDADEIIFTSGGTECNNWVIRSCCFVDSAVRPVEFRNMVPHVVTTNIEHDATENCLRHLELMGQVTCTFVPVDAATGFVHVADVMAAIRPETALVTVMMANNETGVLQPVSEIGKMLSLRRGRRIPFHTDAAQVIGKMPVSVDSLHVDFLSLTGHKFYGPRVGALYRKSGAALSPMLFGGGQQNGLRPGTENTVDISGLRAATELASTRNIPDDLLKMRDYFEAKLKDCFNDAIVINFKDHDRRLPNTSSVSFPDLVCTARQLLQSCTCFSASLGSACHAGSPVPSRVLLSSGLDERLAIRTIRFSIGFETKRFELDRVVRELYEVYIALMQCN